MTPRIERCRTTTDSMDVSLDGWSELIEDLRPLLTYPESQVMVSAAHVVGNMVKCAGANLPDSFFTKEVGQALQIMDGELSHNS